MNSYLDLVREYDKVHRKKNRLTVICIAIAVMLVTAIFGMADMSVAAQIKAYVGRQGNFHVVMTDISEDIAAQIGDRKEIKVADWVGVVPDTMWQERELLIQGSGQALAEQMNLTVLAGEFPQTATEALIDNRALEAFGLALGDMIQVPFADGQAREYRITGVFEEFSGLTARDQHALFLTREGLRAIRSPQYVERFYIQFDRGVNIRSALAEIKAQYGLREEQVSPNQVLLGLMGQSDDSTMGQLYLTAVILFILVMMAGVFMIAGSFHMSVSERTRFFGLLRCLGASKKQIRRYVRREGLRYSLKGIPLGLLTGCGIMWVCAAILNIVDLQNILGEMPLFWVSFPGLLAGAIMGFLVVALASRTPAKKAAGVSPQAAVTGNIDRTNHPKKGKAVSGKFRIDTAMGIHHAFSTRKNMVLTAGSFALSVILLLSFTVLIDFMGQAANPLKPYAPDISVMGVDDSATIDGAVAAKMKELPHIKQFYGRMFGYDIPASSNGQEKTAMLVSYDRPQFRWAAEMLTAGKLGEAEAGRGVLVSYDKSAPHQWEIGDMLTLTVAGQPYELPVVGILSDTPFNVQNGEWVVICAESLFTAMTGVRDYTIIDLQVSEDISASLKSLLPAEMRLFDRQQSNQEVRVGYYTMAVFVYGFLFIIALVSFINLVNIISAGVSNRMNHYGMMRAVGMSGRQLTKTIAVEAAAYVLTGCIVGGTGGLFLHRLFYSLMIVPNWGLGWRPPVAVLVVSIVAALFTTLVAVLSAAKKIKKMSIVNVVNGT